MKYSELLVWQKAVELVAARLDYMENSQLLEVLKQTDEIGKRLSGLTRSLNPQS